MACHFLYPQIIFQNDAFLVRLYITPFPLFQSLSNQYASAMSSFTRFVLINLVIFQCLSLLCLAQDFDFFYFVQSVSFYVSFETKPSWKDSIFSVVLLRFLCFVWFCSGLVLTVIREEAAAIPALENRLLTSKSMAFGLITMMALTPLIATHPTPSIELRYLCEIPRRLERKTKHSL